MPEQSAEVAQTTQAPAEHTGFGAAQVEPGSVQPVPEALHVCTLWTEEQPSVPAVQMTRAQVAVPDDASQAVPVAHAEVVDAVPLLLQVEIVVVLAHVF